MENSTNDCLIERVVGKEEKPLREKYCLFKEGAIRVYPGSWLTTSHFSRIAKEIRNYQADASNINIVTFPKSGTTWVQEIVWSLVCNPNMDHPRQNTSIDTRVPFPEMDAFCHLSGFSRPSWGDVPWKISDIPMILYVTLTKWDSIYFQLVTRMQKPKIFKFHLPLCFLSKDALYKSKNIYVMRDPRDVILSMYHYMKLFKLWYFNGSFDEFVDDFINDRVPYSPYWAHIKHAWNRRHQQNILLISYEDLKANPIQQINKIDKFLGTKRSLEQINHIALYTSFDQMKSRLSDNPPTSNFKGYFNEDVAKKEGGFFRKGVVGDWKTKFTKEQMKKIDDWMTKNLKDFDEDFPYKVEK